MKDTEIGEAFREIRKRFGISQTKAAEFMGMNQAHLSLIEKGAKVPRDETYSRLYEMMVRLQKEGRGFVFGGMKTDFSLPPAQYYGLYCQKTGRPLNGELFEALMNEHLKSGGGAVEEEKEADPWAVEE